MPNMNISEVRLTVLCIVTQNERITRLGVATVVGVSVQRWTGFLLLLSVLIGKSGVYSSINPRSSALPRKPKL